MKKLKAKPNYLIKIILLLFVFGIIVAYLVSGYKVLFNADAAYYLGVTELIYKGKVPYLDFALSYTPLNFYFMLIPRWLMEDTPSYTGYLIANYLVTFGASWLVGKISYHISKNKNLAIILAVLYLLYNYHLEGVYFVLEPMVNFFGLLAVYLLYDKQYNYKRLLLAGSLAGLAFLTKQYGIVYWGTLGLIVLFDKHDFALKIKYCFLLLIGFCLPTILFLIYFVSVGGNTAQLLQSLSGSSYGQQTFSEYALGMKKMFFLFPYLILVPFIFIFGKNKQHKKNVIILFITLLVVTLQFFFQTFLHYSILLLPMVLLLLAYGIMMKNRVFKTLFIVLLFGYFSFYSYKTLKITKNLALKSQYRVEYLANKSSMKNIIDSQQDIPKTMYCLDYQSFPYYFYLGIEPPMLKEYAYSFGAETEENVMIRVKNADFLLVMKDNRQNVNKNIYQYIEDNFIVEQIEKFYLYFRN